MEYTVPAVSTLGAEGLQQDMGEALGLWNFNITLVPVVTPVPIVLILPIQFIIIA